MYSCFGDPPQIGTACFANMVGRRCKHHPCPRNNHSDMVDPTGVFSVKRTRLLSPVISPQLHFHFALRVSPKPNETIIPYVGTISPIPINGQS